MDRILIILKKENGPRASSAPALGLNTIIFKHVYWYMQQISGERLQDHWSSGLKIECDHGLRRRCYNSYGHRSISCSSFLRCPESELFEDRREIKGSPHTLS